MSLGLTLAVIRALWLAVLAEGGVVIWCAVTARPGLGLLVLIAFVLTVYWLSLGAVPV